jgi:hypothetical protein
LVVRCYLVVCPTSGYSQAYRGHHLNGYPDADNYETAFQHTRVGAVPILIKPGCRNVPYVAVEIERLWIGELRVWNSCGPRRPVWRDESSQAVGVVSCPEVIEAGFGTAFFAGELVIFSRLPRGIRAVLRSNHVMGDVSPPLPMPKATKKKQPPKTGLQDHPNRPHNRARIATPPGHHHGADRRAR